MLKQTNAQNKDGFEAGFILGINASQIDGDLMGGFNKVGLRTGVYAQREFKKNWKYRIEMAYSQKGSKRLYNEYGAIGGIWDKAKADYIEVPLMLQYQTKKKIKVLAGLCTGAIIHHSVIDYNFGEANSNFYRKAEFSFIAGIAYPINKKWNIEARYQGSLLSVAKSALPIFNVYTNSMTHKLISVQLVYKLQ